jgi:hypothetical protein
VAIVARVFAPDVRNCSKEFQDVEGVKEIVGIVPMVRRCDRVNITVDSRWIILSLSHYQRFNNDYRCPVERLSEAEIGYAVSSLSFMANCWILDKQLVDRIETFGGDC